MSLCFIHLKVCQLFVGVDRSRFRLIIFWSKFGELINYYSYLLGQKVFDAFSNYKILTSSVNLWLVFFIKHKETILNRYESEYIKLQ